MRLKRTHVIFKNSKKANASTGTERYNKLPEILLPEIF